MSQHEYDRLVALLKQKVREAKNNPQQARENSIKLGVLTPDGKAGEHYKELCIALGLATSQVSTAATGAVAERVMAEGGALEFKRNEYDWLGHGRCF